MRGRQPKDQAVRQRRNKVATEATIEPTLRVKPAPLTQAMMPDGKVHPLTRAWWTRIWKSPIASRWTADDIDVLYDIAILKNLFYANPSASLGAEIRQQRESIGISMMGRKRYDIRIQGQKAETPVAAKAPVAEEVAAFDPRAVLRAVK